MSDLLSLLSLGSSGIQAQTSGVAVATNNVANANTEGYSRQRVDLESLLAAPTIGGVRSGRPDRYQDAILASRMRGASSSLAMSTAFAGSLSDLQDKISGHGDPVHAQLAALFAQFSAVSASPTDPSARTGVVSSARQLAEGIGRRAAELEQAWGELNQQIRDHANAASELASRLAETNLTIARTNDPVARDERDVIATKLTQLVGGNARIDADGQMRFVLDGGATLVDGTRAAKLTATTDVTTGATKLAVTDGAASRDVTSAIGSGAIGAELAVRDGTLAKTRSNLDQLAFDITKTLNATHTAGAALDGTTGHAIFKPIGTVAGAAKAMAIDPDLDADPDNLAVGAAGAGPGDNTTALAMFALADAKVASGNRTLTGSALDMVSTVATATASALADVKRDTIVSEHLASLRDSLAGVDQQEELTNLSKYEHAASAMTKFVSTIDDMLGNLIDRL